LTGKKKYGSRFVRATGKRDAQAQCDRWSVELSDGDAVPSAGTLGDLAAQWIAVKRRRWPPDTLQYYPAQRTGTTTMVGATAAAARFSPD
jgi:hypothetical protein